MRKPLGYSLCMNNKPSNKRKVVKQMENTQDWVTEFEIVLEDGELYIQTKEQGS